MKKAAAKLLGVIMLLVGLFGISSFTLAQPVAARCGVRVPAGPNQFSCKFEDGTQLNLQNSDNVVMCTGLGDVCCEEDYECEDIAMDTPLQEESVVIPSNICNQINDTDQNQKCKDCRSLNGIWTALGCIEATSDGIVRGVLRIGLSIAGGVALLLILSSAFLFATSQGEPKRTGEAKEMLTSAIIGLLFIIFSVTILQFIGVTILHIPEFGTP